MRISCWGISVRYTAERGRYADLAQFLDERRILSEELNGGRFDSGGILLFYVKRLVCGGCSI